MSSINYKKRLLATSIAFAISGLAAPVLAADEAKEKDIETIQVSGIRASQKEALNSKYNAEPMINKKNEKIRSVGVTPCQSAWRKGA